MKTHWMGVAVAALLLAGALGGVAARESDTGPWNLRELRRAPRYEVLSTEEVQERVKGETEAHAVSLSRVLYEAEPWQGKPTKVFAYYARPARASGKLPAVVLVHGGGGKAFPEWARMWAARGYAALAMDLRGNGPDEKRLPDGGPDLADEWAFHRLKDGVKNAWSYHAVADVIRGISLLRERPEVDRNRIGITGISWGGYTTSIVMSLDDRLKAAVPVYGCGFLHENSAWTPILSKLPEDERRTWIANFDPSSYLSRCKIPVLWMNGTNDFAYPLDSYQKSYRAVSGPRTLCVTVKMPHSHVGGWERDEIALYLDSILRPGPEHAPPPTIRGVAVQGEKVVIGVDAASAMKSAAIHWTTDLNKPWQEREWHTKSAEVQGLSEAEATLPETRPAVYFLTATDVRGAVVSTEYTELR
jgi:cephalosporin-C deacetylase-like acetyl esterase